MNEPPPASPPEPPSSSEATLTIAPPGAAPPDTTLTAAPLGAAPPASALTLPPRYRDLGRIASGGFGEIRRVHDAEMDRVVAMKLLRADVAGAAHVQARFVAEAKLTGGLENPGIVSVHDRGRLEDGRLWFTMREVRGRTLGDVIDDVHDAVTTPSARRAFERPPRAGPSAGWSTPSRASVRRSRSRTGVAWCTAISSPTTSWSASSARRW